MLLEIKENKDRGVYTSSYIYKDTYMYSLYVHVAN